MTWGWIGFACLFVPLYIAVITQNEKAENICIRIIVTLLLVGIDVGLVIAEIFILKDEMVEPKIFISIFIITVILCTTLYCIKVNIILNKEWRELDDRKRD